MVLPRIGPLGKAQVIGAEEEEINAIFKDNSLRLAWEVVLDQAATTNNNFLNGEGMSECDMQIHDLTNGK